MSNFIDSLKHARKNIINAVLVDEGISKARFSTCINCEFLTKNINRCEKCGCFMVAKTKLKNAKCPIKKW